MLVDNFVDCPHSLPFCFAPVFYSCPYNVSGNARTPKARCRKQEPGSGELESWDGEVDNP